MTPDPDTWPLAETWEECARHVEAGGVVEGLGKGGVWMKDGMTAVDYRKRFGVPGNGGWLHRRLLPIEDANPEGMTPGPEVDGRPTWYGTASDAQAAGMTEARVRTNGKWTEVNRWALDAIAQARYPLPKPKTERVYWWVCAGREDPNDRRIVKVEKIPGLMPRVHFVDGEHMDVTSPDGTVEVLAEDGES